MAKLTLADLKKLREAKHAEMNPRDGAHKDVQIIVGMGTCGIAAEAKKTFDVLVDELDKAGLPDVAVLKAKRPALHAVLQTPRGPVTLTS